MRPIATEVLRDFCPRDSLSIAPGFNRVWDALSEWSRFSGFVGAGKPLKRLESFRGASHPVETGCY